MSYFPLEPRRSRVPLLSNFGTAMFATASIEFTSETPLLTASPAKYRSIWTTRRTVGSFTSTESNLLSVIPELIRAYSCAISEWTLRSSSAYCSALERKRE